MKKNIWLILGIVTLFFGLTFRPIVAFDTNSRFREEECNCHQTNNLNIFKLKSLLNRLRIQNEFLNESSRFCESLKELLDFQSDRLYILDGLYEIFFKDFSIIGFILHLRILFLNYVLLLLVVTYGFLCFEGTINI